EGCPGERAVQPFAVRVQAFRKRSLERQNSAFDAGIISQIATTIPAPYNLAEIARGNPRQLATIHFRRVADGMKRATHAHMLVRDMLEMLEEVVVARLTPFGVNVTPVDGNFPPRVKKT